MLSHFEKRVLPYTPEQLFDLVLDIEKYPEFLPWCLKSRINERKRTELHADVTVGYKIFREKFTSRVIFRRPDMIEVDYQQGPLRHLQNNWKFSPKGKSSCEVEFDVSFEFHALLLQSLMQQFFDRAIAKMVNAFESRADELYR